MNYQNMLKNKEKLNPGSIDSELFKKDTTQPVPSISKGNKVTSKSLGNDQTDPTSTISEL